MDQESGTSSSQSQSQSQSQRPSICNSQTSHITSTTDQVVTPPASDASGGMDCPSTADAAAMLKQRYTSARLTPKTSDAASRDSQLHHLSAVAAAQDSATIQPSLPMSAPRSNPRRNSNIRFTPTMLSHSRSASSSAYSTPISNGYPRTQSNQSNQSNVEPIVHSPHKNMREQDAIETLLFMSSPGNSANLKHSFSPSGSPGPQANEFPPRSAGDRHALPSSGSRRGLPSNRPPLPAKKTGFDKSPGMPPPHSPMDVDSPQQQRHHTPNRATAKRHAPGHRRSALSLPSGLGLGNGTSRKILRDEDIERMLDRAGAELGDSSDDEEIQLPPAGRNGLARVMGA